MVKGNEKRIVFVDDDEPNILSGMKRAWSGNGAQMERLEQE